MVFKGSVKFEETPPDDFNPEKPYADPIAFLEQREWVAREKLVEIEKAKILRAKVRECYIKEGVNHYQYCRDLVKNYLDILPGLGWGHDTGVIGRTK